MRLARRVLGEPGELRIRPGPGEDPRIAFRKRPPPLPLERPGNDSRPAPLSATIDDPVNEVDKLIRKTHRDLLAHPKMVAIR